MPEPGVVVPYPPPAARVEVIPPQEDARKVWVDGQWEWDRGRFRWTEGKWVLPPPDAYFTPWSTRRRADGTLIFQSAAWRGPSGRRLRITTGEDMCRPSPSGRRTP